jgi:prepilin-type N-terminal cleavage/methylation domain-containing protein
MNNLKPIRQNLLDKDAFTLVEIIVATAILGMLSSIAVPSFVTHLLLSKQKTCIITTTTALTALMQAASDRQAAGWDDLSEYSPVMTTSGPAKGSNFTAELTLNDDYKFSIDDSSPPIYKAQCIPINSSLANYNVLGCVNIETGAFQIKEGDGTTPATKPICI